MKLTFDLFKNISCIKNVVLLKLQFADKIKKIFVQNSTLALDHNANFEGVSSDGMCSDRLSTDRCSYHLTSSAVFERSGEKHMREIHIFNGCTLMRTWRKMTKIEMIQT